MFKTKLSARHVFLSSSFHTNIFFFCCELLSVSSVSFVNRCLFLSVKFLHIVYDRHGGRIWQKWADADKSARTDRRAQRTNGAAAGIMPGSSSIPTNVWLSIKTSSMAAVETSLLCVSSSLSLFTVSLLLCCFLISICMLGIHFPWQPSRYYRRP